MKIMKEQLKLRHYRDLTILGRQRDGGNKLLQINGSKDSSSYIINRTSSAKPSLKLHLLWLEMEPLYQDVKICDFAL